MDNWVEPIYTENSKNSSQESFSTKKTVYPKSTKPRESKDKSEKKEKTFGLQNLSSESLSNKDRHMTLGQPNLESRQLN